jgi:phosphatidate cytidylyltransferase
MQIIPFEWLGLLPGLLVLILIWGLFSSSENSFLNALLTIAGIIYVVFPFSMLTLIGNPFFVAGDYFPWIVFGYFILMWANDVFAYLSGTTFGKHKLMPRVSPKKTWEGLIGGALASIGAAYLVSLFAVEINYFHWIIVSIIIVTFGSLGDLTESLLKRQVGVKDSGSLLPGHGGILDRFDGVLLSAPFVLFYLIIVVK